MERCDRAGVKRFHPLRESWREVLKKHLDLKLFTSMTEVNMKAVDEPVKG